MSIVEPVSLEEARRQLRQPDPEDDPLIAGMISAARDHAERATGLILARRTVSEVMIRPGCCIDLQAWPIAADAPLTITYLDADGVTQTLDPASYRRVPMARKLRLYPVRPGWDIASLAIDAVLPVTVTVEAGYDPADVPPGIKTAMLLLIGHLYVHADADGDPPAIVEALLAPHRLYRV